VSSLSLSEEISLIPEFYVMLRNFSHFFAPTPTMTVAFPSAAQFEPRAKRSENSAFRAKASRFSFSLR